MRLATWISLLIAGTVFYPRLVQANCDDEQTNCAMQSLESNMADTDKLFGCYNTYYSCKQKEKDDAFQAQQDAFQQQISAYGGQVQSLQQEIQNDLAAAQYYQAIGDPISAQMSMAVANYGQQLLQQIGGYFGGLQSYAAQQAAQKAQADAQAQQDQQQWAMLLSVLGSN